MEQENIDVLVTDYKMPGADGMELLKTVKKQYPAVYRVILSGFVEQHLVLRAPFLRACHGVYPQALGNGSPP